MSPCPFCGAALTPQKSMGKVVSWCHPPAECYFGGCAIGVERMKHWEKRVVLMDTSAGYPVFGRGDPVGMDMLNKVVSWYEKQLPRSGAGDIS